MKLLYYTINVQFHNKIKFVNLFNEHQFQLWQYLIGKTFDILIKLIFSYF